MDQERVNKLKNQVRGAKICLIVAAVASFPLAWCMHHLLYALKVLEPKVVSILGPILIAWFFIVPVPFFFIWKKYKGDLQKELCDAGASEEGDLFMTKLWLGIYSLSSVISLACLGYLYNAMNEVGYNVDLHLKALLLAIVGGVSAANAFKLWKHLKEQD